MSFLGRFEKKVEGAVSGVFARAFKGDVQPVEIAARLQRELDGEAKLVSRDRRLVPNDFTVQLSSHDHQKLVGYAHTLTTELVADLKKHAAERGYVFNGPLAIRFTIDPKLPIGRFTVSSQAVAAPSGSRVEAPRSPGQLSPGQQSPEQQSPEQQSGGQQAAGPQPVPRQPAPHPPAPHYSAPVPPPVAADGPPTRTWPAPSPAPRPEPPARPAERATLVLEVNGTRHPLVPPGLTIGRGTDADLRINDPGVSRLHAEIRVSGSGLGQRIEVLDLGSTNGVLVNGQKVQHSVLSDGTRLQIGSTRMLVHAPAGT